MAEKKILIEEDELKYEGLFNLQSFFKEVDQWIRQHGYDRYEKKNYEQVTEGGKQIFIELEPFKRFSDYAKAELRVQITFKNVTDVQIEHDGLKETLQKGNITFSFQARLITDFKHKWEGTPLYQFIRTFVDKFIHKTQTDVMEREIMADSNNLKEEIKAFLNLHRYKV